MKNLFCAEVGNKFPGGSLAIGTLAGTSLGNGRAPISCKVCRRFCSHVPNFSYISKYIKNMAVTPAKHAYMRVKGFFCSGNTGGGRYA